MKLSRMVAKLRKRAAPNLSAEALLQVGPGPTVQSICISMVKNEQDIIEPFLRTNRPYFDAMIIMDNGSTDRTRDIVASCARELGGIFFADLSRFDYTQSESTTSAYKYAQSAFFADFVCFLDADECVGATNREDFLEQLSGIPVGAASEHPWQTFLPDPDAPFGPKIDPVSRLTYRRRAENPQHSKVIFRAGGSLDTALTIQRGAHAIFSGSGSKIAITPMPRLPIRHYPVRNASQVMAKGVLGWMGNLAVDPSLATVTDVNRIPSYQWKRLHSLAQSAGPVLSNAALSDEAMMYAQHVAPAKFADNAVAADNCLNLRRSYSDGQSDDFYRTVAKSLIRSGKSQPVFSVSPPENQNSTKSDVATAFDGDWHWRHVYFDAAPFRYFAERHQPNSVLDIGCGKGLYLRFLSDLGVKDIFGVDGIDQSVTVLSKSEYSKADLHLPFDAGRRFDAVFCLEVAEHLRTEATDTLLDTIAGHAKDLIIFSMAEPGQPGNGHINCRTIPDVLDLWKSRGWTPDLIETLGMRALSTMSWFRRNLLVLRPAAGRSDDGADEALRKIASMTYTWYSQEPGLRQAAFEEPFPVGPNAYGKVTV